MTAGDSAEWVYHDWISGELRKLVAEDLLRVRKASAKGEATVEGFWRHADVSYIACRILFLTSEATHRAALYMAAQTVEKYLKAILLASKRLSGQETRRKRHKLKELAEKAGRPFEGEFRNFCEILEPFEVAGRYDDGHDYTGWEYSINVLSLLDWFVAVSRNVLTNLGLSRPAEQGPVWQILLQDSAGNPFMSAGSEAVRHRNRALRDILAGGRPGGS